MYKTIRFRLEYLFRILQQKWYLLLIGILLGSSFYLFQKPVIKWVSTISSNSPSYGLVGLYQLDRLPPEIKNMLGQGLTKQLDNGKIEASNMVESWQITNDGRRHLFILKSGIYWHNHKELTSQDIDLYIPGVTIIRPDNRSLILETTTASATLPLLLSVPIFKKDIIGTNVWELTKYTYQEGYLKKLFLKNNQTGKSRIYTIYLNATDAILGYKMGEVNFLENLEQKPEINNWPNTQISPQLDTGKYIGVFLNSSKFDKKIRQALAYATPKTNDTKDRALNPINPNSWAYSDNVKRYDFSLSRAKELAKDAKIDKLQLLVNDRNLLPQATAIQEAWQNAFGIKVEIANLTSAPNADFDAILAYSTTTLDPDQYALWHSTQAKTNLTKLNSPRIDKLLEEGRLIDNFQKRKEIYAEFQKELLEESPAIFLFHPIMYNVQRI